MRSVQIAACKRRRVSDIPRSSLRRQQYTKGRRIVWQGALEARAPALSLRADLGSRTPKIARKKAECERLYSYPDSQIIQEAQFTPKSRLIIFRTIL